MNKSSRKDCVDKGLEQTPINLFSVYLTAVKKNIHLILAFSPYSASFKANIMNFPSLINCTTVD